ncbi:MAG: FAD-dependent oxidoreductase [Chloroflexi bacterium]|nr:FAD-dependent oxidoreductase [Chloroflexota bacterium]
MVTKVPETRIDTDVLVIGGGLAGCFAALKAAERGVKVTLLEKANVAHSSSNATGIDHFPYCYIPEVHGKLGVKVQDFVRDHTVKANGIINQDLCEMMWQDSYERLLDLEKIGIKIRYDRIYPWNFGFEQGDYPDDPKFRIVPWSGFKVPPGLNIEGRFIKEKLDARLRQLNVNVLNFHHSQELLTRDGSVVGAVGFNIRTGDFFVVNAKATVLATGSLARLFPSKVMFDHLNPPNQTAEGQTMAFKAGAELAIMEQFFYGSQRVRIGMARLKNWTRSAPATPSGYPAGVVVNAAGEVMPNKLRSFDQSDDDELSRQQAEWVKRSLKEGKTPFYWDATMATEEQRKYAEWSCAEEGGGVGFFLHLQELGADLATHQIEVEKPILIEAHTSRGFLMTSPSGVIINDKTETTLPGLYAAGELAYGQHFPSSPWAYATGARAGLNAAERSTQVHLPSVDERQVELSKEELYASLQRGDGATWQEMNLAINNLMVSYLRPSASTLETGLQHIADLKNERLQASNPHELMRCMETRSLLTVAEIFFDATAFPRQPQDWRILQKRDERVSFSTRPIEYKYPVNLASRS